MKVFKNKHYSKTKKIHLMNIKSYGKEKDQMKNL